MPGNERYDWGKENSSPKGRRVSKTTQRWTTVINGEMRPKQPEPGHISSRFRCYSSSAYVRLLPKLLYIIFHIFPYFLHFSSSFISPTSPF